MKFVVCVRTASDEHRHTIVVAVALACPNLGTVEQVALKHALLDLCGQQ